MKPHDDHQRSSAKTKRRRVVISIISRNVNVNMYVYGTSIIFHAK